MKKAFLLIVLAGVLWGTSGIFVHYLAPYGFSSLQMTAMRGVVSAIAMSIYVYIKDKTMFHTSWNHFILFALSGIAMYGTASAYYASMQLTSISTAVVLMYTAPIFVMAYSVAFLGEKLTRLKTVSVACMLIGCCLVSGIIGGLRFHFMGLLLGFLAGISYSAYNIFTKIQMKKLCHPVSATLYCLITMAIVAFAFAKPMEMISLTKQNPVQILPLMIGVGICTCVLPYFLYTLALKELPVGTAAALGIIEPMAATIFSVVLFQEKLTALSGVGIVLILGAVLLLSRSKE